MNNTQAFFRVTIFYNEKTRLKPGFFLNTERLIYCISALTETHFSGTCAG